MQNIYIYMDDSGIVCQNNPICVYGGIVFINESEHELFRQITLFQTKKELKNSKITASKRLKVFEHLNPYFTYASIIDNQRIYPSIITNKNSRGRYIEYIQKRTVRHIIENLIQSKIINPNLIINLNIFIDEQNFKSNGYYNLYDSIYYELIRGIHNFKYHFTHLPLLKQLNLKVNLVDSKKCYGIQISDIICGSTRQYLLKNQLLKNNQSPLNYILHVYYFP